MLGKAVVHVSMQSSVSAVCCQIHWPAPFIYGLHFNLFLIAYLTHLAIKVKWLFDKCESFQISANCFC